MLAVIQPLLLQHLHACRVFAAMKLRQPVPEPKHQLELLRAFSIAGNLKGSWQVFQQVSIPRFLE